jgi:hypothetical protein
MEVQVMPTRRKDKKRHNPWHARVRRNGVETSLGFYQTYDEALIAELEYVEIYPSQRGRKV